MTQFRYPDGWNTRREPGKRPRLEGTWLDPSRKPRRKDNFPLWNAFRYWTKIHWATPPWMTPQHWAEMKAIYNSAIPGLEEVDHIVPLNHPLVCGLHVPWNMQVLPKRENQHKSNNHWPDCPDHLCPVKNLPPDMWGDPDPHQMRLL